MIKRIISAVCIAIFIAVQTAVFAAAEDIPTVIEDIFAYDMASRNADSYFDDLEYSGSWLPYCYIRMYGTDGSQEYISSVKSYADSLMGSDGFVKPTDLQKAAIMLSLTGECSQQLINKAVYLNENFERQGINAYIWGLIALNCTSLPEPENAINTDISIIEYILSCQLSDGGFALMGDTADCDITASVILSLLPHKDNENVSAALDKAFAALDSVRLENGGYTSMGIENCESSAQAIMAFCADNRRQQLQESGTLDALLAYRSDDGGFSHILGGKSNGIATAQACMALTAYQMGEIFSANPPAKDQTSQQSPTTESPVPPTAPDAPNTPDKPDTAISGGAIKGIICAVSVTAAAVFLIIFFVRGRKNRTYIAVAVILSVISVAVMLSDIKSADEYYSDTSQNGDIYATISVNASNISPQDGNTTSVTLSEGFIMPAYSVSLNDGATAFDALAAACKEQQIRLDYTGTSYGIYIKGIGGIYEFDHGSTSGWLYRVNGEIPSVSAAAYHLKSGDIVEFIYTCTLGDVQ